MEQGREKTAWLHPPFLRLKSRPQVIRFQPRPQSTIHAGNLQELTGTNTGLHGHIKAFYSSLQELTGTSRTCTVQAFHGIVQQLTKSYRNLHNIGLTGMSQHFPAVYRNLQELIETLSGLHSHFQTFV